MDIQQVNTVLNRAIIQFQEGEIEAVSEAAIGGYAIPTPGQMGFGYKPKPPSAFGMVPQRGVVGGAEDLEDRVEFTKAFLKELKKLKKDVPGVSSMRQGYKGTGGNRDNVQVRIRLKYGDKDYPSFDVFVRSDYISLTGWHNAIRHKIEIAGHTPDDAYKEVVRRFKGDLKALGYKVPEKKTKASKKTSNKWKKGKFELKVHVGGRKHEYESVSGYTKGVWGIHKGSSGWAITHTPSGMALKRDFKQKSVATNVMDGILNEDPSLLNAEDVKEVMRKKRAIKNIFLSIGIRLGG